MKVGNIYNTDMKVGDISYEIRNKMQGEVGFELWDKVLCEVGDDVWDEVWQEVWHEVGRSVRFGLKDVIDYNVGNSSIIRL
jgi:glycine cleavage system aminomethyltransferase T